MTISSLFLKQTAVHLACRVGSVDVVEVFLTQLKGADFSKLDKDNRNPLMLAILMGYK